MAIRNDKFFTKEDMELMRKVGGERYNSSKIDDRILGVQVSEVLWGKTLYWHDQVIEALGEEYDGRGRVSWLERGNPLQRFKRYTWTQIYKKGDSESGIFFTIGVGGHHEALEIKLDYKVEGNFLKPCQKELCESIIKGAQDHLMQISKVDLKNYDWNRLVKETVNFIKAFESRYDDAVHQVWFTNQKRLARITYNEDGWRMPSGKYGKSKSDDAHEARYRFGNEEWLFDTEREINGYHYAFLEPIHKDYQAYEGKTFDIILYTVDADTGRRYWVGEIKNLEVIDDKAARKAWQTYTQKGWFLAMIKDIKKAKATPGDFPGTVPLMRFNVRFKPQDGKLFDTAIEVASDNPLFNINRYKLLHYDNKYEINESQTKSLDFASFHSPLPVISDKPLKTEYERQPRIVELTFLHKLISDKLHHHFAGLYGLDKVKTNFPAGYGNAKIDMVIQSEKGFTYYEIKTYNNLRVSIREALGQIIEYSMWPDRNAAQKYVILTQPLSQEETERAKRYFENLRKNLNIDIYYQSFDPDTEELSDEK